MLTVSADSDDVLDALQAGARGYVLKGASSDDIADAVRAVHEGDGVIAPAVASVVVSEIRRSRDRYLRTTSGASVQLTEREWEILELLDRGQDDDDDRGGALRRTGHDPHPYRVADPKARGRRPPRRARDVQNTAICPRLTPGVERRNGRFGRGAQGR